MKSSNFCLNFDLNSMYLNGSRCFSADKNHCPGVALRHFEKYGTFRIRDGN